MYGVVVCSRCKRPKAADLRRKTTTCQCGFAIDLGTAVIRYKDVSALKVAEAVRTVTSGQEPEAGVPVSPPREGGALEASVEAASSERGRWAKASRVAQVLTKEEGSFSRDTFVLAMEMLDLDRPRELLEGLRARDALVRVDEARYSFV